VAIRGGEARNRYTRRYYPLPPPFFCREESATRTVGIRQRRESRRHSIRAGGRFSGVAALAGLSPAPSGEFPKPRRIWRQDSRQEKLQTRTARAMDRDDKRDIHLLLQNDMLALPIFHHAESLQGADNVVRIDCHFFADIWNKMVIEVGFILIR